MSNAYRKGLGLEYFTVGYNVAEASLSLAFGTLAASAALFGFGLDSILESLSGMILVWRLARHDEVSAQKEERIERKATRLVSMTFFLLAVYVLFESIIKLVEGQKPEASLAGIIIAGASLVIMPLLAWKKFGVAIAIKSQALEADAKETLACALLSLALLVGLGLNYLFGLWQADPATGMVIALFLLYEGVDTWQDVSREEEVRTD
jgi:divalent metal cation (Fe/Co/Zn/Cd) transporter